MLSFQLRKSLREFTLDVKLNVPAHTLALIGHSGCGKTTLLQLLAGLVHADDGFIELDGKTLFDAKQTVMLPTERRNIGIVFQNYALFPHLSVGDNIAYGLQGVARAEIAERVRDVLRMFQLESLSEAKPNTLSGGQQQRVALARALVKRPKLLLLDEPLSALDVETRGHVRAELRTQLDQIGIPCIVVTHDYEDARVLGQEIAVMDRGIILQRGDPEEVRERPANRFVAQFVGTNWVADDQVSEACGEEETRVLSFDPWHAVVTREPVSAERQWRGRIRDRALYGHALRLWVDGDVPLIADVSSHTLRENSFEVGDDVCISVASEHIRQYVTRAQSADEERRDASIFVRDEPSEKQTQVGELWRPASRIRFLRSPLTAAVALIAAVGVGASVTTYSHAQGAGANQAGHSTTLTAFVAANATDPFNAIIQAFEQRHSGVFIQASYTGTQILQTQLQQGAPDDLFLSADLSHIAQIKKEGLVTQFYPVSHDKEVIVVPKANPAHITSLADLGRKPVNLIIGVTSVPIGKYTREIFQKANAVYGSAFSTDALAHVVSEEVNVKQILEKVALGDAGAGIVYQTDVTPALRSKVTVIPIPATLNVIATNYIAVPVHAPHPALANALLRMMVSAKGQAIFQQFGYQPLSTVGGKG